MKNTLKKVGKFAYNVKTAPIRGKAKLLQMGANAVGAKGVADMAGKIAQPLSKGGMPRSMYKHGGGHNQPKRKLYNEGGLYKKGEMPKLKPN